MSELFDEEPERPAPERPGRRTRALVITGVVLIVGFFLLSAFAGIYTDRLWYKEVGFGEVFSTMLWTRIGLFLTFGAVMGGVVALNMYLAFRFRPMFLMAGPDGVDRYRDAVTPIRGWLLAGVGVVVGLFAGTSAIGQWRTFLLWRNSVDWGRKDAYFNKDIGFYVFDLPWWNFVIDFVMAVAIVSIIGTAIVHYLYGGIRLQAAHDRFSGAAQVQLSVLLGAFVLMKSLDYYLDRFDLVTDDHRLFTGMNYAGENAMLPARNILVGVALICAVLFFLNVWRKTWQLPSVGLALLALSAVLLGMIWPAIVQNFQVKPSEADKENSYIKANIDATREAYGLSGVESERYEGTPVGDTTQAEGSTVLGQLTTTPVVDPQQVRDTFQQRQQVRAYYSVASVLDVDRYTIDGQEVPLVLGVRELDQSGINSSDQNWSNLHTVYTHGEGLIAAYANRISDSEVNGRIVWAEGISGASSSGASDLTKSEEFEQRIYFGEQSPTYSVVGKASGKSNDVELGLADTDSDVGDQRTTYDGSGGVPVGSTFNQLMYAIKFGEPNFLLSGRVNANSKVLYNRTPAERVEKVAPWLTVDGDPYPAVVDGKIVWILDGYTTTDRYPNSQRESFASMIDDSLQQDTGLQTIPTDEINYMRSAVKATVDAYDGTVTLYQWDEKDPILKTWMKTFPGSVTPSSQIPAELKSHLRYPEDLFKVQRYQLAKYHVTDAGEFYNANNRWEVPEDPNATRQVFQPPYRLFSTGIDGTNDWSLTSVFVPRGKGTLASYLQVNSDANSSTFGKLRLLEMTDANTPGPGQVANQMQQEKEVVDALTPYRVQGATPPRFGNLLTLPVSGGLIYIQPVYAVRTSGASAFPILQFVIVKYGEKVGIAQNLPSALADALGVDLGTGQPTPETPEPGTPEPGTPEEPTGTLDEQIAAALRDADAAFKAAAKAQAENDTAEWARQLDLAQAAVEKAVKLAGERDKAAEGAGKAAEEETSKQ
ncbi:UPF0182 family membrane protein [Nocardioides daeguensis]|uniref:UPF0182 family protein n=1 Tax=Nocardioides daeguensis TaxID=908359 RepID=A0ABP6VTE9_9ACTN|nr:UPF0182 family protein [Nocardioides daeguensis]MBV6728524.1 UPF0182 family protein [Nocardioides daeguensis]MCR1773948.1 UPF0182 family protein [Nocardioides daeguensis]